MVRDGRKDLETWATGWVKQAVGSAKGAIWMSAHEVRRTPGTDTNEAYRSFNGKKRLSTVHDAKSVVSEPDYVASGRADRAQRVLPPHGRSPRPVRL